MLGIEGKMNFLRFLTVPLFAVSLIFATTKLYSTPVVAATQKGQSAHSKKPVQYQYVCPMHPDVTYKKPGKCPKCKMKLERKPLS